MLNALVISATVLGSGMALPQARQLARTRRTDGVSPTWVGVSLALNGWWLAYGFAASRVGARAGVGDLVRALRVDGRALRPHRSGGPSRTRPAARCGRPRHDPAAVPRGRRLGNAPASPSASATACSCCRPSWPCCAPANSAGVSAATWLIAWIESMLWLVYGLGVADSALVVAGVVGVAMSSVILVVWRSPAIGRWTRSRRAASAARWRKAQPSLS